LRFFVELWRPGSRRDSTLVDYSTNVRKRPRGFGTNPHIHNYPCFLRLPKSNCFQAANFGGLIPTESWSLFRPRNRAAPFAGPRRCPYCARHRTGRLRRGDCHCDLIVLTLNSPLVTRLCQQWQHIRFFCVPLLEYPHEWLLLAVSPYYKIPKIPAGAAASASIR